MYRIVFKDFQICRHTHHQFFIPYTTKLYLRGLEKLIGPHKVCLRTWRWVFLRVFEVERKESREKNASGSSAIKRLNASEDECPAPPSSFHLSPRRPRPFFLRRAMPSFFLLPTGLSLAPVKTRQLSCPITTALKHATADQ